MLNLDLGQWCIVIRVIDWSGLLNSSPRSMVCGQLAFGGRYFNLHRVRFQLYIYTRGKGGGSKKLHVRPDDLIYVTGQISSLARLYLKATVDKAYMLCGGVRLIF